MKIISKTASVLLAVALSLCLSSCFDYAEMNRLMLLTAVGVDRENDGFKVSAQVIMSRGGENVSPVMTVKSASAATMSEAMVKIESLYSEPLYFEHIKIVVIGKDALEKSAEEVKLFISTLGVRYDFCLAAAEEKAEDVLKAGSYSSNINVMEAAVMAEENVHADVPPACKGYDFLAGKDGVLPVIRLVENDTHRGGDEDEPESPFIIRPEGGAAIAKGKYAGPIGASYCGVLSLLTAKCKDMKIPVREGKTVAVVANRTDVKTSAKDGFFAEIKLEIELGGTTGDKKAFAEKLTDEAKNLLKLLYTEYKCDVLNLYTLFSAAGADLRDLSVIDFAVSVVVTEQLDRGLTEG